MKIQIKNSQLLCKFDPCATLYSFGEQKGVEKVSKEEFIIDGVEGVFLLPIALPLEFSLEKSHLEAMGGAGTLQISGVDSQVRWMDFEGQIGLDSSHSEIHLNQVKGILRAQLSQCQFHCIANFASLDLDSSESKLELSLCQNAEGRWEIRGQGNQILLNQTEEKNWMVSEQDGDFQHAGSKARVFLNVFGKSTLQWFRRKPKEQLSDEKIDFDDQTLERLQVQTQDLESKNEELFGMFDDFADQIDADYEIQQSDFEEEESKVKTSSEQGSTPREKMLYSLYKKGSLSLEELEKLLQQ